MSAGGSFDVGEVARQLSGHDWAATVAQARLWPPDLFALTSTLLARSGAYRVAVSPGARGWPPHPGWHGKLRATAEGWRDVLGRVAESEQTPSATPEVHLMLERLAPLGATRLAGLADGSLGEALETLLELHALADEACVGLAVDRQQAGRHASFYLRAGRRLTHHGSLSSFPAERIRVVPKRRTPQAGITLRSLSHHLAVDSGEVDLRFHRRDYPSNVDDRGLRVLLFPWPFRVIPEDFRPAAPSAPALLAMDSDRFRFFEYAPEANAGAWGTAAPGELARSFAATLSAARARYGRIDMIALPECAVTEAEFEALWGLCKPPTPSDETPALLAGVRGHWLNEAWLRTSDNMTTRQPKHHRWYLDRGQIRQYGLGHVVHPGVRWWEAIHVSRRSLNVLSFNSWLTVAHLICEDLARVDPVSHCVRAIGPNLIVALLMDGPQLVKRWPGRYATVLADDPGSSVLTLTSAGMARLSCPPGMKPLSTIALWKDPRGDDVEINLAEGATAVVLTLWAEPAEEFTADGRRDQSGADRLVLGDWSSIQPSP